LESRGLAGADTGFAPLSGGRTNRLWRFRNAANSLVCKLFTGADTPLFPNDPKAEATALRHLHGCGIAPSLVASVDTAHGSALVYEHVDGPVWAQDCNAVGALLARLHEVALPKGLRVIDQGSEAILAQAERMLDAADSASATALRSLKPRTVNPPPAQPVFLHGDVVAKNIIASPGGLRLIDWQCPAIGDPTEDLSVFLSPAMQHIYGGQVLDTAQEADLLAGYGQEHHARRYAALAPAYHWRMAAFCLWKQHQGDADYGDAFTLEIARLQPPA
jgi:aminoglycoside phosphotransferase (APT) family kinase protein